MKKLILVLSIFSIVNAPVFASALWHDSAPDNKSRGTGTVLYRSMSADIIQLKNLLDSAPLMGSGQDGTVIDLPLPDGRYTRVKVFESPVLAPNIALAHPDIKTYKAFGIDDGQISGRLDFTPTGFHGMLHTGEGTVYINPESSYATKAPKTLYRSLRKGIQARSTPFVCHTAEHPHAGLTSSNHDHKTKRPVSQNTFGSTLRTYRLALSATREYSMAVAAGDLDTTLAEMVTAVNRINEVYEKNVAITLQLVTGTELISTRKADFSNDDGESLLTENQIWIDSKIGQANYDIGHIFSTGGGGIASMAATCDGDIDGAGSDIAYKAQGVTGSDNPTTDAFYIDYVSHEIGHQFGASHTFNAIGNNAGFCDANREPNIKDNSKFLAASAFEVGSGSTIMSYAGICDTQDLQSHSDAYFHARSIEQIREFVDGDIASTYDWADGSICGTASNTGDIPPQADAGPSFTIPRSTPFILSGTATDMDSSTTTFNYTWEQYDLGLATTSQAAMHIDKGTGPLLRSRPGTDKPDRYFPALDAILSGNLDANIGERLPTTDRTMNFRLTLRTGKYGVAQDDMTITVDKDAGPFAVTAPTNTANFSGLQNIDVTWNVANTTSSTIKCNAVDISFSSDGGASFGSSLLADTPNDGSATVALPNINTDKGRIKVACRDNIFFNVNPGNLNIIAVANSISISGDPAQNEGNLGSTGFNFSVSLIQTATTTISVQYNVQGTGVNAADSADFGGSLPSGVLTFAAGQKTLNLTIPVTADTATELNETFSITLKNATNAGIGTSTASGAILNDDNATTLNISATNANKQEGENGTSNYFFTITRLGLANITSSVTYTVAGTGIHPATSDDFASGTLIPLTATLLPGETSKTITVNVNGDTQIENDETFAVILSNSDNAIIDHANAGGTIIDDDRIFITQKKKNGGGQISWVVLLLLLSLINAKWPKQILSQSKNDQFQRG